MNAKFDIGGYELQINDTGYLTSPDGKSGAHSGGNVGLQILHFPLPNLDSVPPPTVVLQTFLKPSQARAVASALLSAATEVRRT